MEDIVKQIQSELEDFSDEQRAEHSSNYFKNRPGYAPDDLFLGVRVPIQRKIANKYYKLISLSEIPRLLASKWHEERLTALFILVKRYQKFEVNRQEIFNIYFEHLDCINNWDLVDSSAPHIVGEHLKNNDYRTKVLDKLAKSKKVWERRIAVLAAGQMINYGSSAETIRLAIKLMNDQDEYIHKANGWMLREVGKKISKQKLINFLNKYAPKMPRTMLRYSIEHFDDSERQHYLKLKPLN